ncbi:MAG: hypothetical protein QXJ62_07225 [Nitrososphaeria archaeon]
MEKKAFKLIIELENRKKVEIEETLKEAEKIKKMAEIDGKRIYEEIIKKKIGAGNEEAKKIVLETEKRGEEEYKIIMHKAEKEKEKIKENVKLYGNEAIKEILEILLARWKE